MEAGSWRGGEGEGRVSGRGERGKSRLSWPISGGVFNFGGGRRAGKREEEGGEKGMQVYGGVGGGRKKTGKKNPQEVLFTNIVRRFAGATQSGEASHHIRAENSVFALAVFVGSSERTCDVKLQSKWRRTFSEATTFFHFWGNPEVHNHLLLILVSILLKCKILLAGTNLRMKKVPPIKCLNSMRYRGFSISYFYPFLFVRRLTKKI